MRLLLFPAREARCTTSKSILFVSFTISTVFGQVPFTRPGSFELGPFVGASYGIVDAQYMVGGNLTFAVNRFVLPYVEYSYLPEVARPPLTVTLAPGTTYTVDKNISFSDFHGGVHLRFPIHEKPIVPYLAFGVGTLAHSDQQVTYTYHYSDGTPDQKNPSVIQPGGADFAINGGGGLRYYFKQNYGIRVEAKVYKPTGTFSSAFGKVEFGFFYQFR